MIFSAYDMDYPDLPCFVSAVVPEALLKQWLRRRLILSYEKVRDDINF